MTNASSGFKTAAEELKAQLLLINDHGGEHKSQVFGYYVRRRVEDGNFIDFVSNDSQRERAIETLPLQRKTNYTSVQKSSSSPHVSVSFHDPDFLVK